MLNILEGTFNKHLKILKKQMWSSIFELLAFSGLFIGFTFFLGKAYLSHEPILKMASSASWMITTASYIAVAFRKFLAKKQEQNNGNAQVDAAASRNWWRDEFPTIVALGVPAIPLVVFGLIIAFQEAKHPTKYVVSDPSIEAWGYFGWLLMSIFYLIQAIEELTKLEKQSLKRILKLVRNLAMISGGAIYFFYSAHLTEVP